MSPYFAKLASRHDIIDFFPAIGTVCFNTRLGCLEQSMSPSSLAGQMLNSTNQVFEAVQKTTFAFPWYALFKTKMYQQYAEGKLACERYMTLLKL